jgi:hypothetical protein
VARIFRSAIVLAIALLLSVASAGVEVQGQTQPPAKTVKKKATQPADKTKAAAPKPAPKAPPAERPQVPDETRLTLLIQSYLIALSQANLTGNYSVLHALGAPSFQQNNPPDKLAQVFGALRSQNIDLTPLILFKPILDKPPAFEDQGLLHLIGHYDTAPQQVQFDLTLQPISGVWRLFGLSVKAVPAKTAPAGTAPEAQSNAEPAGAADSGNPVPPVPARKPPKPKKSTATKAAPVAKEPPIRPAIGGH